ncbi:MAG: ABC transporter ATP-binding protein [Gemmataceae bacterium]
MSTVIATHNLTKRYGGKTAVDRLTLDVPAGSIYALLGDNGAGKSSTIRVLTGQQPADAGRAEILGQDCWANAVALRHRVGYVPERPRFYDWMTVTEIGGFVAGFHKPGFELRYRDLVENFRLDAAAKLKNLSKGGYAKVGLALALAIDPEVLILDEPTSGLDLLTRREFLASMVDLAGEGRTILISSHQISEVERVASHVAILAEGKLVVAEPLEDLKKRFVRLRLRHEGAPPDPFALGTILERNGSGRMMQLVLRDPRPDAIDLLRNAANVFDVEESSLTLEEIYAGLLTRPVKAKRNGSVEPEEAAAASEEERP